jgi:hypothetical protein
MPVGHKAHQLTMFIMRTISPCCSTFNSCKCNYRISTSSSSTQLHVTKNAINTLLTNDLSECVHIVWNRWQRWIENEVTKITNLKHFCKKKKKINRGDRERRNRLNTTERKYTPFGQTDDHAITRGGMFWQRGKQTQCTHRLVGTNGRFVRNSSGSMAAYRRDPKKQSLVTERTPNYTQSQINHDANSMQQSPWKAHSHAASQYIFSILQEPKVCYNFHNSLLMDPILRQLNPGDTAHPIGFKYNLGGGGQLFVSSLIFQGEFESITLSFPVWSN